MRHLLKRLVNTITGVNLVIAHFVAAILLLFGGIMLFEAISRHFFDSPTTWAFEISKMAFGFYMICGGAYTMIRGDHVSMDLLYSNWPPRTKAIMDSITFICFLLFITTLLYLAAHDAMNSISFRETSNSTLAQPLYQWKVALAVAVGLLFLQGAAGFIKNLWFAVYGEEL